MKILLLADVKGQGKKGDVINVSDGYARNCLLPKKLAKEATAQALNELNNEKKAKQYRLDEEIKKARADAAIIDGKKIEFSAKAGGKGKLFGSVTAKEIAAKIQEKYGVTIDKRKISISAEIKSVGAYECEIKLHNGINAKVTVVVTEE